MVMAPPSSQAVPAVPPLLPLDVFDKILSTLPAYTLLRARAVCRWVPF